MLSIKNILNQMGGTINRAAHYLPLLATLFPMQQKQ